MATFEYPKILNLIWDSSKLTFLNYLTILSFKKYHKDWDIHIYYTTQTNTDANWKTPEQKVKLDDSVEDYWDHVEYMSHNDPTVKLICVDEFIESLHLRHLNIVQQSDILRIYILYTYGGVYSDFDIIYIKNIENYFINHQDSNLLFFGIEPNGYIYFPVGFFITKPRQESYKKILQLQLLESNHPAAAGDYQYFGTAMFRRLRSQTNSIIASFKLLPAKCYLPVFWFEIDKKLYSGNLTKIDSDSFGIHWFNGSAQAKQYINTFNPNKSPVCTMDYLISEYTNFLKYPINYKKSLTPIPEHEDDNSLTFTKLAHFSIPSLFPIPSLRPSGDLTTGGEDLTTGGGDLSTGGGDLSTGGGGDLSTGGEDFSAGEDLSTAGGDPSNGGGDKDIKISIVMSYINRSSQLKYTLQTIRQSSYKNIEVVIVDDGSLPEQRLEDLINDFDMEIVLVRIDPQDKKWINPCVPYNIGLGKARGDIIIIQNPEVCHIGDIISYCRENASDDKYITFSVISSLNEMENQKIYNYRGEIRHNNINQVFTAHSWYNHPTYRNSQFHFLSCMTRSTLDRVGGFNEEFKNGLSYDDDEFVGRIRKVTNCITLPPEVGFGIHLWHPGGSAFYDNKVDLLQTLININSQLHKELVNSPQIYCRRGEYVHQTLSNKNVIIFGGEGMLGRYVVKYLQDQGFGVRVFNRSNCDAELIRDTCDIEKIIGSYMKKNTVVVNCYGKIPQKGDIDIKTFTLVNTLFPIHLSNYIYQYNLTSGGNVKFINITTDCVFSGLTLTSPESSVEVGITGKYTENHISDVGDIYGVTKWLGETKRDTIIRTSIVGEEISGKKSLLEWVKSRKNKEIIGYTNHYWNGVTCLELSKIIYQIIGNGMFWNGVRHFYCRKKVSKYQLVSYINSIWNLGVKIIPGVQGEGIVDKTLESIFSSSSWPCSERSDTRRDFVPPTERSDIETQLRDLKRYGIS